MKNILKMAGFTKIVGIGALVIFIAVALFIFQSNDIQPKANKNSTKVILLGAPGSGKGTVATTIIEQLNIPQISTGEMLRAAIKSGTKVGLEAKAIMEKGGLVSDEIVIKLLKERITKADCANGYLLDGVPRTLLQAEMLKDSGINIDYVIELNVDQSKILGRITGRRVHPNSGRTYHVDSNPPKVAGKDDVTGEPLVQRADDTKETVLRRLDIYNSQTKPLIDFYKNYQSKTNKKPVYMTVDGNGSVQQTKNRMIEQLKLN